MPEEVVQWEYQVFSLGSVLKAPKDEELEIILDEWGQDGWELISVIRGENTNRLKLIAKRPLTFSQRRRRTLP